MANGLERVADELGVAVSTVSRALAGKPGVSAARRERIVALAAEMGIVPDPSARALRSGKGSGLVVITQLRPTGITAQRNQSLFYHGKEAFGHTRVVIPAESESLDAAVGAALNQRCRAIAVSGVGGRLSDTTIERLHTTQVPLVVIDSSCNAGDHFRIDRSAGTCQCARLLVLNERQNIVVFSNTTLDQPDPRLEGFARGMASLGKQLDASQVITHRTGAGGGYETMREVLSRRTFDGAFCYSDDTAFGMLRALSEAGVRVPHDTQVVGFDNIALSSFGTVPLTTVAQPVDEIARAAVETCLERADNYQTEWTERVFPTRLIARASAPITRHDVRAHVFEESDTHTADA